MSDRAAEAMASFFDFSRPLVKLTLRDATPLEEVIPAGAIRDEIREPASLGRGYAQIARAKEESALRLEAGKARTTHGRFSTVDTLTSCPSTATEVSSLLPDGGVLRRYDFGTRHFAQTLPIAGHRAAILSLVASTQVVILRGATGCGKSTQVPQYLLEEGRKLSEPVNIVVTQPRRIAAATLARRVCLDRGWELGSLVGYQVGLDGRYVSEDTRLLFCTTGVLLQRLVSEKTASSYTHIIIDEVHERTQEMDFLLVLIKKMLTLGNSTIKVILMSATISVDLFAEYFTTYAADPAGSIQRIPAPILDLDRLQSMVMHKVGIFYLEDLKSLRAKMEEPSWDEPQIEPSGYAAAVELLAGLNRLPDMGAALVFLPGINEIETLFNELKAAAEADNSLRWLIKPLHSTLTMDEQSSVFQPAPEGFRKIILSTNIAESSITVSDIAYVVDFCLTKHLVCDQGSNFSSLHLAWASRSNCIQRAGRAGRTCAGRVYRLVPRKFFMEMNEQDTTEMLRGPLERVVLLAKMLEMGSPQEVIGLAPEPPDLLSINKAVLLLKEKGALLPTLAGRPCAQDGDITFMGRLMSKLPIDPALGKLILLGHAFGVLHECIVMAAAMTLKSIFSAPFQRRLDAYNNRLAWADSSCSDCISFLNAYEVWVAHVREGFFDRPGGSGPQVWADGWLIQLKALQEVQLLVKELHTRLAKTGISEPTGANKTSWDRYDKPLVLKMVLAGAFYPNYFGRGWAGGQVDEEQAVREVNGQDPRSTVYLTGMPVGQPKRLYTNFIKDALAPCSSNMLVTGDPSSGRVYVTFVKSSKPDPRALNIPGSIEMGVYRAVKMRQLNLPMVVPIMKLDEALKRATELGLLHGLGVHLQEDGVIQPTLPKLSNCVLDPLVITYKENVGHFWAQRIDASEQAALLSISERLQDPEATLKLRGQPKLGHIYAVPYSDNTSCRLYRAQLIDVVRKRTETTYEVYFIDYGNRKRIPESELRELGPELLAEGVLRIPPAAFECVLAETAPSSLFNLNGLWSKAAQNVFEEITENNLLSGEVYSVVRGVVALKLRARNPRTGIEFDVNGYLKKMGYAQTAEESQLSKRNHEARERASIATEDECTFIEREQRAFLGPQLDVPTPDLKECTQSVMLRGPTSPLEMRVYGMTREGTSCEVTVDGQSVNSVLLDTAPQDPHERLLVAASVSQSPKNSRVTLRHTTLLPNVHGLPALLCLIFSPCVELRADKELMRYTGALCGLGTDINEEPLFPKHDMEVPFDTEFISEDLDDINKLRHQMNRCFVPQIGEEVVTDDQLTTARQKIKETLQKLLRRSRKSIPLELYQRAYKWHMTPPKLTKEPCSNRALMENLARGVFQFHWGVRLRMTPEMASDVEIKIVNLDKLREQMNSDCPVDMWYTCRACQYTVSDHSGMEEHLRGHEHIKLEGKLRAQHNDHQKVQAYFNKS